MKKLRKLIPLASPTVLCSNLRGFQNDSPSPYLRLWHVTAETDIRLSFISVPKNKSSKENNLNVKLDDTRHTDTQFESDPETIPNQGSGNAKEDKVKTDVTVSPRKRSSVQTKKKYRRRRRKTKHRTKPLLDNTDKDRREINSDDTPCAVDSDHEFETETEVKQPIIEYNCFTSESKSMLSLSVPKLVENSETFPLGKYIYNILILCVQGFRGELKNMKDIKYLHKMEDFKSNNSNDMQSV